MYNIYFLKIIMNALLESKFNFVTLIASKKYIYTLKLHLRIQFYKCVRFT